MMDTYELKRGNHLVLSNLDLEGTLKICLCGKELMVPGMMTNGDQFKNREGGRPGALRMNGTIIIQVQ